MSLPLQELVTICNPNAKGQYASTHLVHLCHTDPVCHIKRLITCPMIQPPHTPVCHKLKGMGHVFLTSPVTNQFPLFSPLFWLVGVYFLTPFNLCVTSLFAKAWMTYCTI